MIPGIESGKMLKLKKWEKIADKSLRGHTDEDLNWKEHIKKNPQKLLYDVVILKTLKLLQYNKINVCRVTNIKHTRLLQVSFCGNTKMLNIADLEIQKILIQDSNWTKTHASVML